MTDRFPLRYYCPTCGQLLYRSTDGAEGQIETVCGNRSCPSRSVGDGRVRRLLTADAGERPDVRRLRQTVARSA